jgi:NADP-dependent 3-hydroxy acid dehydrogenase YdfG
VHEYGAQEFGKPAILINNAGLWLPLRDFVEEMDELWNSMTGVRSKGFVISFEHRH